MNKRMVKGALAIVIGVFCVSGAETYTNPIIPYQGSYGPADPHVIYHQGTYYLYCTGDNSSYHVWTSPDLVEWTKGDRVFQPEGRTNVWAPSVYFHPDDGKFYLYYSVQRDLGVAVADSPDPAEGFQDKGKLFQGAIDGDLFRDEDGKLYLYYAEGANTIYVQPMSDPLTKSGSPIKLLEYTDISWERPRNEGPEVIKRGGTYYLLYSGKNASNPNYAVGYATSESPLGPFTKYENNPIVHKNDSIFGPGHGMLINDANGDWWHVYHQKEGSENGWDRFICIDPVWFDDSCVMHSTVTRGTAQPAPVPGEPMYEFVDPRDCSTTAVIKKTFHRVRPQKKLQRGSKTFSVTGRQIQKQKDISRVQRAITVRRPETE